MSFIISGPLARIFRPLNMDPNVGNAPGSNQDTKGASGGQRIEESEIEAILDSRLGMFSEVCLPLFAKSLMQLAHSTV